MGALVALILAAAWFIHYERQIGVAKFKAKLELSEAKWKQTVEKVQTDANLTIGELNAKLDAKLSAPPINPSHVRVCINTPTSPSPMSSGAPSVGASDAAGRSDSGVETTSAGGDIGPGTEAILGRLSAKIEYLQGYVRACQKEGVCKKETD